MPFYREIEDLTLHAVSTACIFIGGMFSGFVLILPYAELFLQLSFIGVVMIALRAIFLFLIPELVKYSGVVAVTVTTVWASLSAILDAVKLAIFAIIDLIASIDHLFHGHMKRPSMPDFIKPRLISAKEVRRELHFIAETCQHYAGVKPIWNHVVRDLASPTVCPVLRAVYPLGPDTWYKHLNYTIGWLSYDSEPYPGGNCPTPDNKPQWVCVALGSGYIMLELLVPMLMSGIFLFTCRHGISKLIGLVFTALITALSVAATFIHTTMKHLL